MKTKLTRKEAIKRIEKIFEDSEQVCYNEDGGYSHTSFDMAKEKLIEYLKELGIEIVEK